MSIKAFTKVEAFCVLCEHKVQSEKIVRRQTVRAAVISAYGLLLWDASLSTSNLVVIGAKCFADIAGIKQDMRELCIEIHSRLVIRLLLVCTRQHMILFLMLHFFYKKNYNFLLTLQKFVVKYLSLSRHEQTNQKPNASQEQKKYSSKDAKKHLTRNSKRDNISNVALSDWFFENRIVSEQYADVQDRNIPQ